MIIDDRQ